MMSNPENTLFESEENSVVEKPARETKARKR